MAQRTNPLQSPFMDTMLKHCAHVHQLESGQTLPQATSTDSLFVVREGTLRLRRGAIIHREVHEGFCLNEEDFVQHTVSGQWTVEACDRAIVLELPVSAVNEQISSQPTLEAVLYTSLCRMMALGIQQALQNCFPGTWSASRLDWMPDGGRRRSMGSVGPVSPRNPQVPSSVPEDERDDSAWELPAFDSMGKSKTNSIQRLWSAAVKSKADDTFLMGRPKSPDSFREAYSPPQGRKTSGDMDMSLAAPPGQTPPVPPPRAAEAGVVLKKVASGSMNRVMAAYHTVRRTSQGKLESSFDELGES